jgi:hypothetical protein
MNNRIFIQFINYGFVLFLTGYQQKGIILLCNMNYYSYKFIHLYLKLSCHVHLSLLDTPLSLTVILLYPRTHNDKLLLQYLI